MSSLVRQKSLKNIILKMQKQRKQLNIDELKTQPTQPTKSHLQLQTFSQKYDQSQHQKTTNLQLINGMVTKTYDANLIYLDDSIEYNEKKEYLKRFYYEWEHNQKLILLGDYYQFHVDQPRIFLKDIHQIVTDYQEDKRQLEYQNVKDKINHQKPNQLNHPQNLHQNHTNSNKNILKPQFKPQKSYFILKDLLDHYDIQKKKQKTQNHKEKNAQNPIKTKDLHKHKVLQKTSSFNSKKMFSSKSEQNKFSQNHKNSYKLFSIKDAKKKELKNLQSKYTEVISEIFKKRRQSSKPVCEMKKIQNKLHEKSHKISEQKNMIVSCRQEKSSLEKSKKKQTVEFVRSKSLSHMNFVKPHTFLKPNEPKISSKLVSVKPITFTSISASKKGKNMTQNQSSKIQKGSSNQSKKDKNSPIKYRGNNSVKVFEITRKDLIQDSTEKEPLISGRNKGKQNEGDQNKRVQEKPEQLRKSNRKQDQLKNTSKREHKRQQKHEQKGGSMFSRVIKNKIRS